MAKTELEIEHEWNIRKALVVKPPILIGAQAVLDQAKLRPDFLVENRITRGSICMLAGPPGSSKSWLAYDLAIGLAQGGSDWIGQAMNARAREKILILNYDNPTPELGRRMLRLGLEGSDTIQFHSPEREPLKLMTAFEDLQAMAAAVMPSLIIVDSLRQAHTSDENDSGDMAAVMGQFKVWVQETKATVLLIHHTSKDQLASGTATVRGSVEIPASCDVIIEVGAADRGISEARWTKHRSWPMSDSEEALRFAVKDYGEETRVEAVAAVQKKGRP